MADTLTHVKQNSKSQVLFQGVLLSIVALWTLPVLIWTTFREPDHSCQFALHRITLDGLRYGRDIIVTYGPLGYLRFPLLISRNLWLESVVYIITNHLLFFFCLFLFIRKEKLDWIRWVFLIITVFMGIRIIQQFLNVVAAQTLIALFIFNYLYLDSKKTNVLFELLIGILHSLPLYIKFSDGLSAVFLLVPFLLLLLFERRGKEAFIIFTGYFSATVILGLLLIGSPGDIALFFYHSFQVANGYADVETIDGPRWQVYVAILSWMVYLGLMSYAISKKQIIHIKYFILAMGLLFMSFKQGFMRHDRHVLSFFFVWTIVFTLHYLITSRYSKSFLKQVSLLFALVLFLAFIRSGSFYFSSVSPDVLLDKFREIRMSLHMIADENFMNSQAVKEREIYDRYSLQPQTCQLLSGHTVDIFPWDIAITEQYGFRWIPRPLFQSYFVFTDSLESLNQRHFLTVHSPEYLLYSFKSIDGRYPLFDEPATFRTLLKNYHPISIDGEFIVLRKKGICEIPRENTVFTTVGKIGEVIPIPKGIDGYLFARIYIDSNVWWKIVKFFYKPPQVYIQFIVKGKITPPYRFIPSTARNGVFLSQFIRDQRGLYDVWDGRLVGNLDAIIISAQNAYCYKKQVRTEFFTVPKN